MRSDLLEIEMAAEPDVLVDLRAGDTDALARAYDCHGRMVYNVCLRVLGEASAAEDATQAVFLLLWRKARALPPEAKLAGWLHRTAAYVAREGLRAERRRRRREQEAIAMAEARDGSALESERVGLEIRPVLDRAVAALPESYRAPVVLVYLEGRERREAAQVLGIPEGTLRWRLAQALERLRRSLGGAAGGLSAPALEGLMAACGSEAELPGRLRPKLLDAAHGGLAGLTEGGSAAPTSAVERFYAAGLASDARRKLRSAVALIVLVAVVGATGVHLIHGWQPGARRPVSAPVPPAGTPAPAPEPPAAANVAGGAIEQGQAPPAKAAVRGEIPELPAGVPRMVLDQTETPQGGRVILYSRHRYGNYPLATFALHLGLRGDDRRVRNEVNLLFGNVRRGGARPAEDVNSVPGVQGNGACGMDAGPNRDEFRVRCMGGDASCIRDLGEADYQALRIPPQSFDPEAYRAGVVLNHVYLVRLNDPDRPELQGHCYKLKVLRLREDDAVLLDWEPLAEPPAAPSDERF